MPAAARKIADCRQVCSRQLSPCANRWGQCPSQCRHPLSSHSMAVCTAMSNAVPAWYQASSSRP